MWGTLIDQTAALERQSVSSDASAGTTKTFSTAIASVPVSIQPMKTQTIEDYMRRSINVDTTIYSTLDFDMRLSGGLKDGDRFSIGGIYFIVYGVRKQLNLVLSSEPLYEVACKRMIV